MDVSGFEDISMEEMRHSAYEALKAGNIMPYVSWPECIVFADLSIPLLCANLNMLCYWYKLN